MYRSVRNLLRQFVFKRDCVNVIRSVNNSVPKRNYCFRTSSRSQKWLPWASYAGLFSFLGLTKSDSKQNEEETMRDKTVKLVKMAIIAKQEGKLDTSEQLFHLALKMAQEQVDYNGVTYIYDAMANLALERGDFVKAEKLFKDVTHRLVSSGTATNDPAIIEISIKLASIYSQLERNEEADSGFQFCFQHLENKLKLDEEDADVQLLMAMCADSFAKHHMKLKNFSQAEKYFNKAYDISVAVNGVYHPQSLVLLNNLGSACSMAGNLTQALQHFSLAVKYAKTSESDDLSAFYRNIGMVHMQIGELAQAELFCKMALNTSKEDNTLKNEAQNCLDAIRKAKN